ncbi:nuclear transport factor 2 family protein [Actinomycetospora chiangmaiensis]|uniref:nuclear transport factor 2 family protein n=1 Tax=Actinomycetospora chiangmaiensis TaxID=402650 RepID=UPI00035CC5BC|nr:nuclear transport factor 2 family protein [Actinomycetospora chiangmaiensis]
MYHAIVRRIARQTFDKVAARDYAAVLAGCSPDIHHRFGGDHALGGERHSREALGRWFDRLGRLTPTLAFEVTDVWVKGLPHDTVAVIRWQATQEPLDGVPYFNHGVHVVRMRWGKAVEIDANENSQLVADYLDRLAARGVEEAAAAPITG